MTTPPTSTMHGTVWLSHHQLLVQDAAVTGSDYPYTAKNGLVVAQDNAAVIFTGVHTGPVEVTAQLFTTPPHVEAEQWEEVVELSVRSTTGRLYLIGLMGETPAGFSNLAWQGPGVYRIRVHAYGRDTNTDGTAREPTEKYLIQLWPTEDVIEERAHKHSDQYGAQRRGTYTQSDAPLPAPSQASANEPPAQPSDSIRAWRSSHPDILAERGRRPESSDENPR